MRRKLTYALRGIVGGIAAPPPRPDIVKPATPARPLTPPERLDRFRSSLAPFEVPLEGLSREAVREAVERLGAEAVPPYLKLCHECNARQMADEGKAESDGIEVCDPCADAVDAWPDRWGRWKAAEPLREWLRKLNAKKSARQKGRR